MEFEEKELLVLCAFAQHVIVLIVTKLHENERRDVDRRAGRVWRGPVTDSIPLEGACNTIVSKLLSEGYEVDKVDFALHVMMKCCKLVRSCYAITLLC